MSAAAIGKRLDALAAKLAPPAMVGSAVDVFRAAVGDPDPWQEAVLASDARRAILLCSRQSGKSTVTSALAAHEAASRPGSLVLIVSPSLRQSGELFRKTGAALAALGQAVPPAEKENATTVELANGSRVVSLPGSERTVRGYSAPDLVIEDEAARVADAMHFALRPMLATGGGRFVLLSSPFGRRGHFFETWERGGADWHRVKITAADCPRIDPAWLAQERRDIGPWWAEQEFDCVFRDAVDAYFRAEDIEAMASSDVAPLFDGGGKDAA